MINEQMPMGPDQALELSAEEQGTLGAMKTFADQQIEKTYKDGESATVNLKGYDNVPVDEKMITPKVVGELKAHLEKVWDVQDENHQTERYLKLTPKVESGESQE